MHHPVQVAEPAWQSAFDTDPGSGAGDPGARPAPATRTGRSTRSAPTSTTRPWAHGQPRDAWRFVVDAPAGRRRVRDALEVRRGSSINGSKFKSMPTTTEATRRRGRVLVHQAHARGRLGDRSPLSADVLPLSDRRPVRSAGGAAPPGAALPAGPGPQAPPQRGEHHGGGRQPRAPTCRTWRGKIPPITSAALVGERDRDEPPILLDPVAGARAPRRARLPTTTVMFPPLRRSLRPRSRWQSGPRWSSASSAPNWPTVRSAARISGSRRAVTESAARMSLMYASSAARSCALPR